MAVCILKQLYPQTAAELIRQLLIPSVIVSTHPGTAVVACGWLYPQTAAELTQAAAHTFPSVLVFTHPETAVVPCCCMYPQTAVSSNSC